MYMYVYSSGKAMKVSLSNLIEPASKRRLRRVDREHVQSLKDSFTARPEVQTIFCGNITGGITKQSVREQAMRKNAIKVEVIGGNHTRIALQELANEGKVTEYVLCNVYLNLNDAEALKLGYDHNVINDIGKSTSAEDLLLLFRQELEKLDHIGNASAKMITWKENLAFILGIDKTKLHNVYHSMISLVNCSDEVWEEIKTFLNLWKRDLIEHKPKGEIKKSHFSKFANVKNDSERLPLLRKLNTKVFTWREFNVHCATHSRR